MAYWILDGYTRTGLWQESAWVKWVEYGVAGLVAVTAGAWKHRLEMMITKMEVYVSTDIKFKEVARSHSRIPLGDFAHSFRNKNCCRYLLYFTEA
ncbi:MAG: hypothetical protein ACRENG_19335 [bacterium]